MSRYKCHICRREHGTDNVVAVCVQCYASLREELAREKEKTSVYQHVTDAQMGECDCYQCTIKYLEQAEAALKAEERLEQKDQFDWDTGECIHGLIGNYFTCNGAHLRDPKSRCERNRFNHCCWHMKRQYSLSNASEKF